MPTDPQPEIAGNSDKSSVPEELRPFCFKPGQSGNPSGRPKKKHLTEVVEELLEEKLSDPLFRATYKESLWKKLLDKGVVSAMTLDKVWERTEGKVAQSVELSGNLTIAERMRKAEERVTKDTNSTDE